MSDSRRGRRCRRWCVCACACVVKALAEIIGAREDETWRLVGVCMWDVDAPSKPLTGSEMLRLASLLTSGHHEGLMKQMIGGDVMGARLGV